MQLALIISSILLYAKDKKFISFFLVFAKQAINMSIYYYLTALIFIMIMLAYLMHPALLKLFIKDMRALRVLHGELMLLLGVSFALTNSSPIIFFQEMFFKVWLCMISLFFACLNAIVIN